MIRGYKLPSKDWCLKLSPSKMMIFNEDIAVFCITCSLDIVPPRCRHRERTPATSSSTNPASSWPSPAAPQSGTRSRIPTRSAVCNCKGILCFCWSSVTRWDAPVTCLQACKITGIQAGPARWPAVHLTLFVRCGSAQFRGGAISRGKR